MKKKNPKRMKDTVNTIAQRLREGRFRSFGIPFPASL